MAGTFIAGEVKVRPSAYFRITKKGGNGLAGADDGTTAAVFRSDFGPLGVASELIPEEGYVSVYGDAGTTDVLREVMTAGVKKAICVRLGSGGTAATVTLKNSAETPADVITITAKHPGSKAFSVTVKTKASDTDMKQCIIYSGEKEFERVEFAAGTDEISNLVTAFASSGNFSAVASSAATGTLADVNAKAFTAGTDPTITNADYSAAFGVLEAYRFNTICVDTNDHAVHLLLAAFLDRIFNSGQLALGVVAEAPTVSLDDREANAVSYNSEKMIYLLNSNVKEGDADVSGYLSAARIAGEVAVCPSNQSLTHYVISGWSNLNERLTPSQIIAAEQKGCLVLTMNSSGQVWIDNAINTLVTPDDNQDDGWKKIRRTKTRYELITRCNDQADSLIGKVDNDENGRATVVAQLQGIVNAMISEGKLVDGTVSESTTYTADGDYAYFDIAVIDKDSIEKAYLVYQFQFSSNVSSASE